MINYTATYHIEGKIPHLMRSGTLKFDQSCDDAAMAHVETLRPQIANEHQCEPEEIKFFVFNNTARKYVRSKDELENAN